MASGYERSPDYGGPEPTWRGLLFALATLLATLLLAFAALAQSLEVKDGDDIILDGKDHRFEGADAFERSQECKDENGNVYKCGENAKAALQELIKVKPLDCRAAGNASDGRPMLRCSAELDLIRAGWAFPRRDFLEEDQDRFMELCAAEKEARDAKRGAWAGTFEIPFVHKNGTGAKVWFVSCPEFPVVTAAAEPASNTESAESVTSVAETHDADLPRWVQLLSALLTPAIALLAAVIAWAQWRAVRRREGMELFERRMATYDALRRVLANVVQHGSVTDAEFGAFQAASDRVRFLFGPEVLVYLDGLRGALRTHQRAEVTMNARGGPDYDRAVGAKHASFEEVVKFYEAFPKLIAPYVRMDQKLPR